MDLIGDGGNVLIPEVQRFVQPVRDRCDLRRLHAVGQSELAEPVGDEVFVRRRGNEGAQCRHLVGVSVGGEFSTGGDAGIDAWFG